MQTSGHSLLKAFGVLSGAQTPPLGAAAGGAVLCLPSRQNPGRTLKGPGARMAWRSACGVGAGPQCRAYRLLGVGRGLKPFPMGSLWAEPGGLSVPRRHEVNPQAEKGCDLKPPPPAPFLACNTINPVALSSLSKLRPVLCSLAAGSQGLARAGWHLPAMSGQLDQPPAKLEGRHASSPARRTGSSRCGPHPERSSHPQHAIPTPRQDRRAALRVYCSNADTV